MRPRTTAIVVVLAASALALAAWSGRERAAIELAAPPRALSERLLGPIADLAANVQWVRVDDALRLGRPELAYARAETALSLAPGDPAGWCYLANHFIYERASELREPDRVARARWIQAGLDVLARGEKLARDPGRVAFRRGTFFVYFALLDDSERAWPGTRREAWLEAAAAFDRAALHGEPMAAEAAAKSRLEAEESNAGPR
jgi:hypothetical protein